MENIVLIGMPGSGKSTVGVVLAKMLGLHFLDSDLVIQETEGKLLSEIIEEKGPDGFLTVEDRINAGLQCEKTVIATGGSAVFGANAMAHLKEIRLEDNGQAELVLRAGQTVPVSRRYLKSLKEAIGL